MNKVRSVGHIGGIKKLKVKWSPELAADLAAYHSFDAEAELTSLLEQEIAKEMINDLISPEKKRERSLRNFDY